MNGVIEEYLQSIEDKVLVEDKIVTYKGISRILNVHINTAKQLLHAFTLKEEFKEKLLVTYLIAGEGKDDTGLKFCLVKQENVDKVKQSLEKVISEHVYSIQKSSYFDAKNLYNADLTELNEGDRKFCSIQKNEDILKRIKLSENKTVSSSNSIVKTSNVAENKAIPTSIENKADSSELKNSSKAHVTKTTIEKAVESKRSISPKKDSTKTSPIKAPTKSSPTKPGTSKNKKLKNVPSKGSNIGSFFNKQAALAANKKTEVPMEVEDEVKEESKENIGKLVNQPLEKNKIQLENGEPKHHTPPIKKKENSKKRKKRNKDFESANKRRKRIVVASDSESSEKDSEDEREPSPEPEPEPEPMQILPESDEEIIPPTPTEKGRKRVRKQVNKTFEGENGYIETKKEYVYESCSDDDTSENNIKVATEDKKIEISNQKETENTKNSQDDVKVENNKNRKKTKNKSPKKSPPKNKNKQATIMNFFKKK